MNKLIAVIYGVVVYGFFGLTWTYFIGFLTCFAVPKSIDSGAIAPLPEALAVDIALLALFFAHHSVMARARAKFAIARFVAPAVERSTYVLIASLALALLMAMWRPMPQVVWQAGAAVRIVALVVFWTGVLVTLAASNTIDGLALFGVRQVLAYFRGREIASAPFRTPGLYRLVRHPMMTGMLMTFWAWPIMTQGRLLLAVAMSGYILAAVKWLEERDLRKAFGAEYERYERQVPMLVPVRMPRRSAASEESELRRTCDNFKPRARNSAMKPRTPTKSTLSVGTLVKFMFGGNEVQATIIEDRGPVGAKGRRILRVRLELDATDPLEFEVPADDVQIAA